MHGSLVLVGGPVTITKNLTRQVVSPLVELAGIGELRRWEHRAKGGLRSQFEHPVPLYCVAQYLRSGGVWTAVYEIQNGDFDIV